MNIGINKLFIYRFDEESFIELRQPNNKELNDFEAESIKTRFSTKNKNIEVDTSGASNAKKKLFNKLVVKVVNCFDNETEIKLNNLELIPNKLKVHIIDNFLEKTKIGYFEKN